MNLRLLRVVLPLLVVAAIPLLLLGACQSNFIYIPRAYSAGEVSAWQRDTGGQTLKYTTSEGRQRAYLQGNLKSPRNLWIACAGNGSLVLEWSAWLAANAPAEDAWLLVDYPGYGECEGSSHPETIRESLQKVVPIAAEAVGFTAKPDPSRLRVFGHSLGAAAGLIAAEEFGIRDGVLLAPFTSTMEMSGVVVGVPLGFLVTHRFDNAARLDSLLAGGPARFAILHGSHDEVIPVRMGRELAAGRGDHVRFVEIDGGRHNDIARDHPAVLVQALAEAGAAGRR
jgi:pimeloyl-ACP methyl ester carboxylesterase